MRGGRALDLGIAALCAAQLRASAWLVPVVACVGCGIVQMVRS